MMGARNADSYRGHSSRVSHAVITRPIIAVTCLSFEARVAAGPGIAVLCGTARPIDKLGSAVRRGGSGIISIGIAGGLAPGLAPGHWVVASGVVNGRDRYATDPAWSSRLLEALPSAVYADISALTPRSWPRPTSTGCTRPPAPWRSTPRIHCGADRRGHGIPFAARVIIDPAEQTRCRRPRWIGVRSDGRGQHLGGSRFAAAAAAPVVRADARGGRRARGALSAVPGPPPARRWPELPASPRAAAQSLALEGGFPDHLVDFDLDGAREHGAPALRVGLHPAGAGDLPAGSDLHGLPAR